MRVLVAAREGVCGAVASGIAGGGGRRQGRGAGRLGRGRFVWRGLADLDTMGTVNTGCPGDRGVRREPGKTSGDRTMAPTCGRPGRYAAILAISFLALAAGRPEAADAPPKSGTDVSPDADKDLRK